jgi:hypothetical protein
MDLLNIEPQKVSTDLRSYTTFMYGNPKAGKTEFIFNLYGQDALFLRTEKGTKTIPGLMGVDIGKWSDLMKALQQLRKPEVKAKFKVVVVDTVDNLYKYLEKFVKTKHGAETIKAVGDGFGQGHAELSDTLFDALQAIENEGYTPVFISHSTVKTEKIPGTKETNDKYIPSVPRRGLEIMTKMVDNILFAYLSHDEAGNEVRTLYTRETAHFQAGSRFKHLPSSLPLNADVYREAMVKAIEAMGPENLKSDKEENFVKSEELNFDELMKQAKELAVAINKAGRMPEVLEIVEKTFGQGKLLKDATKAQVEQVAVVVDQLQEIADEIEDAA